MIIVMHQITSLKSYLGEHLNKSPEWNEACPACGWPRLRKHGRFWRQLVLGVLFERVPVYRLLCPGCEKTFSLIPSFMRPYSQFGVHVHEAAARMLGASNPIRAVSRRLCSSASAGGVSQRTVARWLQQWRSKAQRLLEWLVESILRIRPGFDTSPYLPRQALPRAWIGSVLSLAGTLRDIVDGSERVMPVLVFLNIYCPRNISL